MTNNVECYLIALCRRTCQEGHGEVYEEVSEVVGVAHEAEEAAADELHFPLAPAAGNAEQVAGRGVVRVALAQSLLVVRLVEHPRTNHYTSKPVVTKPLPLLIAYYLIKTH